MIALVSAETRRRTIAAACLAWLVVFAGLTAAACLSGCGASALPAHAAAADAVGVAVTASGDELLLARRADLDAAHMGAAYREDAQAAVSAVQLRYEPAVSAYEALRTSHDAWVSVLVLAAAGELDDPARWATLAVAVVRAWSAWAAAGDALGLDVPAPPAMLAAVAGAP